MKKNRSLKTKTNKTNKTNKENKEKQAQIKVQNMNYSTIHIYRINILKKKLKINIKSIFNVNSIFNINLIFQY